MALLDKINLLKKKKEEFPHFDEKFGKPSGTAVPGPSADIEHSSPSSGFTQIPSAAPSNEKLDSIQRSVQLLNSTLEQLKRNMDSISQRMSAIEGSSNPQPRPQPVQQQSRPQINPYTPPPQLIQPSPQPQPAQPQTFQQPEQPKKPVIKEEEEDSGWHF